MGRAPLRVLPAVDRIERFNRVFRLIQIPLRSRFRHTCAISLLLFAGVVLEVLWAWATSPNATPVELEVSGGLSMGFPNEIAYSPDGADLAVLGHDGVLRLWDSVGRLNRTLLSPRGRASTFAFAGTRNLLYLGTVDGAIEEWDYHAGHLLRVFQQHTNRILSLAIHGQHLISGSRDGTTLLWNLRNGQFQQILDGTWARQVVVFPDGNLVGIATQHGIVLWSLDTQSITVDLRKRSGDPSLRIVLKFAVNPSGTNFAAVIGSKLELWDTLGRKIHESPVPEASVVSLQFWDDSTLLVARADGIARLDLQTLQFAAVPFNASTLSALAVPGQIALSPDRRYLARSYEFGFAVWSGGPLARFRKPSFENISYSRGLHLAPSCSIVFPEERNEAITVFPEGSFAVWDLTTARRRNIVLSEKRVPTFIVSMPILSGPMDQIDTRSHPTQVFTCNAAVDSSGSWLAVQRFETVSLYKTDGTYQTVIDPASVPREVRLNKQQVAPFLGKPLIVSSVIDKAARLHFLDQSGFLYRRDLTDLTSASGPVISYDFLAPPSATLGGSVNPRTGQAKIYAVGGVSYRRLLIGKEGKLFLHEDATLRPLDGDSSRKAISVPKQIFLYGYSPPAGAWIGLDANGSLLFVDPVDGSARKTYSFGLRDIFHAGLSRSGRLFAHIDFAGKVTVVDLTQDPPKATPISTVGAAETAAFSPDDRVLLVAMTDGRILNFDTANWTLRWFAGTSFGTQWFACDPSRNACTVSPDAINYVRFRFEERYRDTYYGGGYGARLFHPKLPPPDGPRFEPKPRWLAAKKNEFVTRTWLLAPLLLALLLDVTFLFRKKPATTDWLVRFCAGAGYRDLAVVSQHPFTLSMHPSGGTERAQGAGLILLDHTTAPHALAVLRAPGLSHIFAVYPNDPPDNVWMNEATQSCGAPIAAVLLAALQRAEERGEGGPVLNNARLRSTASDPYDERKVVDSPGQFFGRADQISRMQQRLARGENICVYGLRKYGKTSLVRSLIVQNSQIVAAQIDLRRFGRITADFAPAVFETVWTQLHANLRSRGIRGLPRRFDRGRMDASFQAIADCWRESGGDTPLVVVLDEVGILLPDDEQGSGRFLPQFEEVFSVFRALSQAGRAISVVAIDHSPEMNRRNRMPDGGTNPVFQFFHEEPIQPLKNDESIAMLVQLGSRRDISWDPEAALRVATEFYGHPFFIRQFASEVSRRGEARSVTIADVEALLNTLYAESLLHNLGRLFQEEVLEGMWKSQAAILNRIALHENGCPLEELLRDGHAEIALFRDLGLVTLDNGKVRIASRIFERWLQGK